jgi:formate hydrogenlyase transcriptional activator
MDESLKAQLQATLDIIPAFTWYAAPSGALLYVNSRSADYLGLPPDHPLRFGTDTGAAWDSHIPFLHPDDHEETRRVWSDCLKTGCPGEVSFRVRNAEGHYRWFLSRAEPRRGNDGTLLYWIGINLDIEERKRAEQELRDIVDTIPAVVWVARPDGSNAYANRRFVEYSGMVPAQTAGSGWRLAVHPDDLQKHESKWRASVASGEPHESEVRFRGADGEYRWHLDRGLPWRDEEGHIIKWYGVVTDIEDRKRVEEALRRNEHYLAEAQRLSHTGSFGWKPEDGEIVWSEETYRIFEYDRTVKPTVDSVVQRIHPDDRALAQQIIDGASLTGTDFEHEYRLLLADGRVKHVHAIAHAVNDASGHREFIGAVTDVTERKTAEEKIRTQEAELRQMLDFAPQLIGVLGPRLERLYANRVALAYYGVTLDDWRRSSPDAEIHPDDVDRVKALFDRSLTSGAAHELEMEKRLRGGDGTYRWFLVRYNPLRDDQGQIVRWYIAGIDIDDRKRDEDKLQQENVALREEIDKTSMFEEIVGGSPVLIAVLSQVSKVASSDSTVLITGETGTGKELVARAIHRRSRRASRGFVAVNCAAIPRDLIASELFGHEKGAFTGALQRRLGRFELADGGTIFLDEVGELASDTQVALLRVLQEREFERVGGQHPIRVDVRVVAATNRDLSEAVADGTFRQDLFYRLNVFPLEMPPLRDRQEDIAVLVEYFIDRYARKAGKTIRRVSKRTLDLLKSYPWPGNVRELQNVIERSVIVSDTDEFTIDESWLSTRRAVESRLGISGALASHEKALIEDALRATEGRVFGPSGAAARLGIPRSTLESKIRTLKINKSRFRTRAPKRS